MPLNQPNLCSAPRVLEVTRIIMRGVVPINSQLLVLISAPASDERSGASRRPNHRVPGVLVPAPPLTRVMSPATLSISGGAVHVSRHLHTLSALLFIYPCSFRTISFIAFWGYCEGIAQTKRKCLVQCFKRILFVETTKYRFYNVYKQNDHVHQLTLAEQLLHPGIVLVVLPRVAAPAPHGPHSLRWVRLVSRHLAHLAR